MGKPTAADRAAAAIIEKNDLEDEDPIVIDDDNAGGGDDNEVDPQSQPRQTRPDPKPKAEESAEELIDDDDIPGDISGGESGDPAEKKEEKPAEFKLPEEPKGLGKDAAAAFKVMRTRIEELEKSQKENAGAGNQNQGASAEVIRLKKELTDAQVKLGKFSIMEDPAFQAKYKTPMIGLRNKINQITESFGGKPELIDKALAMDLKTRKQFLQRELSDAVDTLMPVMMQVDELRGAMNSDINDFAKTKKNLEKESSEKIARDAEEHIAAAVAKHRSEKNLLLLRSAKDDKWNAKVDARVAKAKQIILSGDREALTEFVLLGQMAQDYRTLYEAEKQRRLKAEGQASSTFRGKPKLGGGSESAGASGGGKKEPASIASNVDKLTAGFS